MMMNQAGKVSLLIAEDDAHIRYLIEAAAERTGCFSDVVAVVDGQSALAAVRDGLPHRLPDLIVSDLCMPNMTGLELIRAVKGDQATRHIPIAIITSSDLPNDRADALAAGAFAFEPKPHGLEALSRALARFKQVSCEAVPASS